MAEAETGQGESDGPEGRVSTALQDLPPDCLNLIIEFLVDYDFMESPNLKPLIQLRFVSRRFNSEITNLLYGKLVWRLSASERKELRDKALLSARPDSEEACKAPVGHATDFLGGYVTWKSRDQALPWNTNLFTVIHSVIDVVMKEEGLEDDDRKRLQDIVTLCGALSLRKREISREFGIWDLFHWRARRLLAPTSGAVTRASFQTHVFLARIYLNKDDSELRSAVLESESTKFSHHQGKDLWEKPIFGGFLEAAIRTRNPTLTKFLLSRGIDSTHLSARGQGRAYDVFFLKLAAHAGDAAVMEELLRQSYIRDIDQKAILMHSVCSGQHEALGTLLNHWFPPRELTPAQYRHYHHGHRGRLTEMILREAVRHKNTRVVQTVLSCRYVTTSPYFLGEWNRDVKGARWSGSWGAARFGYQNSAVQICVNQKDKENLKLLLDHGANPHGKPYYVSEGGRALDLYKVKPLMLGVAPLYVCAWRGDMEIGRMLLDSGFSFDTNQWLEAFSWLFRQKLHRNIGYEWMGGDYPTLCRFSQWLAHTGAMDMSTIVKEGYNKSGRRWKSIDPNDAIKGLVAIVQEPNCICCPGRRQVRLPERSKIN